MRLLLLCLLMTGTFATGIVPAQAARSDWDPNDVRGGFDYRWIAASYTREGRIRVTVSFYPGFRAADLPRGNHYFIPGVWIHFDEFFTGWFIWSHNELRFGYGDTGGSCCHYYPVTRIDPLTLRVRVRAIDEGKHGIPIRGQSRWRWRKGPHDWTGVVKLPAP